MILKTAATIILLVAIFNMGGTTTNDCQIPLELLGNWVTQDPDITSNLCCMPVSNLTFVLDSNGNVTLSANSWGGGCSSEPNNILSFSALVYNEPISRGWMSGNCCPTPEDCYEFLALGSDASEGLLINQLVFSDAEEMGCNVVFKELKDGEKLGLSLVILLVIACFFL